LELSLATQLVYLQLVCLFWICAGHSSVDRPTRVPPEGPNAAEHTEGLALDGKTEESGAHANAEAQQRCVADGGCGIS
jgi:hypothetical protein